MKRPHMERVTIRLPRQQVEILQLIVDTGDFPSVSEAIRAAIRELIDERGEKAMEMFKNLSKLA